VNLGRFVVSGICTDPWSYQVDILVLSMDLTAGKTWDQLTDQGFLLVLVCAPPLVRRESPQDLSFKRQASSFKLDTRSGIV